ncbi:hypothetical protein ABZW11_39495, partial [Nonomuraea sp. NPDC004580]
ATPGALPASSALPATVPAVAAAVHPVEPAEQVTTDQDASDRDAVERDTTGSRNDQAGTAQRDAPAQHPTGRDTTPDATGRDTGPGSAQNAGRDTSPDTRQETSDPNTRRAPVAATDQQTIVAPPRTDTTAPPPPPARQAHGDRPADVIVAPARPHDVPGLPAHDQAPAARTQTPRTPAPETDPPAQNGRPQGEDGRRPADASPAGETGQSPERGPGQSPERVGAQPPERVGAQSPERSGETAGRGAAHDQNTRPKAAEHAPEAGVAPQEARRPLVAASGGPDAVLVGGHPAVAPSRPRSFAEAAATFHRWTPGNGEGLADGPNRIERLLTGQGDGRAGVTRPDPEFLLPGWALINELPTVRADEATALTLAQMHASLPRENSRVAVENLAEELFNNRYAVDAVVELYQDAQRQGMAPEAARGSAMLADALRLAMPHDALRWLGYRHRALLDVTTPEDARTLGLLVNMMSPHLSVEKLHTYLSPWMQQEGLIRYHQVLPLVRAADAAGFLPPGLHSVGEFHAVMAAFRQVEPELWTGVVASVKLGVDGLSPADARMLGSLHGIAGVPDVPPGMPHRQPLESLAHQLGQGGSVEQLLRLAADAREHGSDPTRAADLQELHELLATHRARDPHLWDGLRLADDHHLPAVRDDQARVLGRLAELAGPAPDRPAWVFDPLRRLAYDAGLGHSVPELVRRAEQAGRAGLDLSRLVNRRQVVDALRDLGPRDPYGVAGDGRPMPLRDAEPGLHNVSPEEARAARRFAEHHWEEAFRDVNRIFNRGAHTAPEEWRAAKAELGMWSDHWRAWGRWPDVPEMSFTGDFAAYRRAYERALARVADGETLIPYMMHDVTAGLGTHDRGYGFAVKIEFDLPARIKDDALATIDAALRQARLIDGEHGWQLLRSAPAHSVLVSPLMHDVRSTWSNLKQAVEIINAFGGVATYRTAARVEVSTGPIGHMVDAQRALATYVDHHADTLFRLAQNPEREEHNGLWRREPNEEPLGRDASVEEILRGHGRFDAIDMTGIRGGDDDRVEFRLWDGSLDPAVIQTQVKLSLAIVEAAVRNAGMEALPNGGHLDAVGSHDVYREAGAAGDLTEMGSLSFRMLADELFWRADDKEQLLALFAATRWPSRQPWQGPPTLPARPTREDLSVVYDKFLYD